MYCEDPDMTFNTNNLWVLQNKKNKKRYNLLSKWITMNEWITAINNALRCNEYISNDTLYSDL